VRGNCHAATVPPRLLCDTTVAVANIPPDDAELELLLTRLLRMVSPDFTTDRTLPAGRADEPPGDGRNAGADGRTPARAVAAAGVAEADVSVVTARRTMPAVSASEARALIELVAAHGIAQGELASLLGLDKSTVSRLAAGLERKGWLRRGRDEDNQRYVRLYLTPLGSEVAERVWQAWQSRQARILAGLSADERAGLAAGLRGLVRGLAAEKAVDETADSSG